MTGNQFVGVMAIILVAVGVVIWSQTVNQAFGPFESLI